MNELTLDELKFLQRVLEAYVAPTTEVVRYFEVSQTLARLIADRELRLATEK